LALLILASCFFVPADGVRVSLASFILLNESNAVVTHAHTQPGARIMCTTILENEDLILSLFGAKKRKFRPSIPNLAYEQPRKKPMMPKS
jgi:hypothetical protein